MNEVRSGVLHKPETVPYWRGAGVLLQVAVGGTFGMVVGQALEIQLGGRPFPPGAIAWTGLGLGAVLGGVSQYAVTQARARQGGC